MAIPLKAVAKAIAAPKNASGNHRKNACKSFHMCTILPSADPFVESAI